MTASKELFKSTPLSYLTLDSLRNPTRADVFLIVSGLKTALSNTRLVVELVTSVESPPITPAKQIALLSSFSSEITISVFFKFLSILSNVTSFSSSVAFLTIIFFPNLSLSKACSGWPKSINT